jgi:hypothetical protein
MVAGQSSEHARGHACVHRVQRQPTDRSEIILVLRI